MNISTYHFMRLLKIILMVVLFTPIAQAQDKTPTKVSNDLMRLFQNSSRRTAALNGDDYGIARNGIEVYNGLVVIEAIASGDPNKLLSELEAQGLQYGVVAGSMVGGQLPIGAIGQLSSTPSLKFIRPAYAPITNIGSVTSQGDSAQFSDVTRELFGVDGNDITVGIISDAFNTLGGADAGIATGDLPGPGNPLNNTEAVDVLEEFVVEGIDEGRAMAEIVHDVAPGASLKFHAAFNAGQPGLAAAVTNLRTAGSDVIVDDVAFLTEPFFQDGVIAQAVDNAVADGAVYFSSAGNSARQSYESEFRPGATVPLLFGNYIMHDFDPGPGVDYFQAVDLVDMRVSFQWDNPYASACEGCPGAVADLDFFIAISDADDFSGILYQFSGIDVNAGFDPVEFLGLNTVNGQPLRIYFAIGKFDDGAPNPTTIKYIESNGDLTIVEYTTNSPTVFGHSNAEGSNSIGAAFYGFTPPYGVEPANLISFSSVGGNRVFYDKVGNRLPAPITRLKPEVVGPNGANTTFFTRDLNFPPLGEPDGFPNFFGTSASAPHVAAIAALMLEAESSLSPAEIREILQSTALDMDNPYTPGFDEGFDFATGTGYVNAFEAVGSVFPTPYITSTNLFNGVDGSPVGNVGDTIDLIDFEDYEFAITVDAFPGASQLSSVRFKLDGPTKINMVENKAPYSLFGDNGKGKLTSNSLKVGNYNLTVTPYTKKNAKGDAGIPLVINFDVVYSAKIDQFVLANARTLEVIQILQDNDELDATQFLGTPLDVNAEPNSENIGSVIIELNGKKITENKAPYSLTGEKTGWMPEPGSYSLKATPYSEKNGRGNKGMSTEINIEVTFDNVSTTFVLVNARNGKDIGVIEEGSTFDFADLDTDRLNIRADIENIGSVILELIDENQELVRSQLENKAPYTVFDDAKGGNRSWDAEIGGYEVSATPYLQKKARGVAGNTKVVSFSLTNSSNARIASNLNDNGQIDLTSQDNATILIYPNPVVDYLNIDLSGNAAQISKIRIFDMVGNEVLNKRIVDTSNLSVDMGNLSKGLYILKVEAANITKSIKFLKQ